jgi:hypothetical protein
MGQPGEDIQLSSRARDLFPYSIESKNLKRVSVYKYYRQAQGHGDSEPLVVIKQDRSEPLVLISLDHFLNLIERLHNDKK